MSVEANPGGNPAPGYSGIVQFVREWIRAPLRTGAIAPSGPSLARAITKGLSSQTGPVLELGPGTGVFTEFLLANGVPMAQITAIEASENFAHYMKTRYPGLLTVHGDAARLASFCPFPPGSVGAVVCGLPLLSMPSRSVMRILTGSFSVLRKDGEFRLFTYSGRCPVASAILDRLELRAEKAAYVPTNIPPAWVYRLTRRDTGNG